MTHRPLIVLSLEGLAASSLGCYGSSWNATPTFDSLASTGCVWDRFVATSDRPSAVLEQWTSEGARWRDAWRSFGSIELITDGEASNFQRSCFDEVLGLTSQPPTDDASPAADVVDTQLGRLVAAAIERDAADQAWSVLWLHSRFLTQCWDAPRDLISDDDQFMDGAMEDELGPEDDSASEEDEAPIDRAKSLEWERLSKQLNQVLPPSITLDESTDPDVITAWMRTYACQVRLVDLLLEILLQSTSATSPIVAVTGTSGFRLGQDGQIGHRVGPLRSPDIRLPLLINSGGPLHVPQLTASSQFPAILEQLARAEDDICPPEMWSGAGSESAEVVTDSDRAAVASNRHSWFYVQDADQSEHLFLKPDDIEDFNDVGRLRTDVLETFRSAKE